MKVNTLYFQGNLSGVRVTFFELERAYDIGIGLFNNWDDGSINLDAVQGLELVENKGRFYTKDEFSKNACDSEGRVVKNYLEFSYDTEACNLLDFIRKFPKFEAHKTKVKTQMGIGTVVDLDFSLNRAIVEYSSGVTPWCDSININDLSEDILIY